MPIHQTARTFGARRVPTLAASSGCWQLGEVTQARRDSIWPANVYDPFFSDVQLLLPMNGTNGSAAFTDESSNGFTVTANGNSAISTSQSKFGGAAAAFDGSGDWLEIAYDPAFDLTGDFTVECWFYPTASSGDFPRLWAFGNYNAANSMTLSFVNDGSASGGSITLDFNGPQYQSAAGLVSLNAWQHIAVVRSGSTVKVYLDGTERLSQGSLSAPVQRSQPFIIGNLHGFTGYTIAAFAGYIDDLRITSGTNGARYTAAFTPPTAPHPTA